MIQNARRCFLQHAGEVHAFARLRACECGRLRQVARIDGIHSRRLGLTRALPMLERLMSRWATK